MQISLRTKDAIKTALSMFIVYYIALSLDWDNAYWAGFAVAFSAMATVGQTLSKGIIRLTGSLLAMLVALLLVTFFPQDRWLFMITLTAYGAICCYVSDNSKDPYFWQVSWFVTAIICMDTNADTLNAFGVAVLRVQETAMGIVVYSMVSLFLWPRKSEVDFKKSAIKLAEHQNALLMACAEYLNKNNDDPFDVNEHIQQVQQASVSFNAQLSAAEIDSQAIYQTKTEWRNFQLASALLSQEFVQLIDIISRQTNAKVFSGIPQALTYINSIHERLKHIVEMIENNKFISVKPIMRFEWDSDILAKQSHAERAVCVTLKISLERIEEASKAMINSISNICYENDIKQNERHSHRTSTRTSPKIFFFFDPDSISNTIRFLTMMWLTILGVFYVSDIPGGPGLISICAPFAILFSNMPQVRVSMLIKPTLYSLVMASIAYIYIMPHLTSYLWLGLLLFCFTFIISYQFYLPKQVIGKALGIAVFLSVASISNQQIYSILVLTTTISMFVIVFAFMALSHHFPISFSPNKVVLRLLKRFIKSCRFLMAKAFIVDKSEHSLVTRYLLQYARHEVMTIPSKISGWLPYIDKNQLSKHSLSELESLFANMQIIANYLQELSKTNSNLRSNELICELTIELNNWLHAIQAYFMELSESPGSDESTNLNNILLDSQQKMNMGIDKILTNTSHHYTNTDIEIFYKLLSDLKGLSLGMQNYISASQSIDWQCLEEERF